MSKCSIEGCNNIRTGRGNGLRRTVCDKHHRLKYPRNEVSIQGRRERQPPKSRLRNYGLTSQEYNRMLSEQRACCSICGEKAGLAVDHCHKSGIVRGLLCNKCNWGLGMFNDDIDLLASVVSYLLNNSDAKEIA